MNAYSVGSYPCDCTKKNHDPLLIAVTGGPGAGKTAILEFARRSFCSHVGILPESAGIVFGGGFPRHDTHAGRVNAQLAIFDVQRALEGLVQGERKLALALCDRGTLDGIAYWPGSDAEFYKHTGTSREVEFARYSLVIHLRTPAEGHGYRQNTDLRVETAAQASVIDERISQVWDGHPHVVSIPASRDFMTKTKAAIEAIHTVLPECCHTHGPF